jgi:hypothetical protein
MIQIYLTLFLIINLLNLIKAIVNNELLFSKYPNYYFIETGCYRGDGLLKALSTNAFDSLFSIEYSSEYYQLCNDLFKENNKVCIIIIIISIHLSYDITIYYYF